MADIILITGGSRSGKSAFAQKTAETLPGPRACIATCPAIDPETEERVRKHREARRGKGWETIEETVDLAIGKMAGEFAGKVAHHQLIAKSRSPVTFELTQGL